MMAAASAQAPPVIHAIGGALGSALALLLFYPLERARIELQSEASRRGSNPSSAESNPALESVETQVKISNADPIRSPSSSWIPLNQHQESQEKEIASSNNTENSEEINLPWSINSPSCSDQSSLVSLSDRYTRKQSLMQCLANLRYRGELYTGVSPVVSTIVVSQFIFFYMHAVVKKFLKTSNKKSSALLSLLSSCIAGLGNVLLTNPLWVVNMAIVTGESKSSNLWKELYRMIKEYGPKHMWKGTSASVLLVSNPVIQFFCYEQMKVARTLSASKKAVSLPPMEAFVIGAMAKGVATLTTYPLQLAQTILRLKDNRYKGTSDCLLQLYKEEGLKKLFTGMRAKLLQTVLTAAFTFLTYEQILGVVQATLIKGAGSG